MKRTQFLFGIKLLLGTELKANIIAKLKIMENLDNIMNKTKVLTQVYQFVCVYVNRGKKSMKLSKNNKENILEYMISVEKLFSY